MNFGHLGDENFLKRVDRKTFWDQVPPPLQLGLFRFKASVQPLLLHNKSEHFLWNIFHTATAASNTKISHLLHAKYSCKSILMKNLLNHQIFSFPYNFNATSFDLSKKWQFFAGLVLSSVIFCMERPYCCPQYCPLPVPIFSREG